MSLEAKIEALTAAIEANTAALGAGGTPAKKPATSGAKKPAAGAKKSTAKPKGPTADDLAEAFGSYMKSGDEDERAEAKTNVRAIIEHMETDRITNLDPSQFAEAIGYLDQFKAGENPFEEEGGEAEDDDLM